MVGRQDFYQGNILFYDYLSTKRNPVFLTRNYTRALQIHQQILEQGGTCHIADDHEFRHSWGYPSWDELDRIMEHEKTKGVFEIEVIGIRPTKSPATAWTRSQKRQFLFRSKVEIQLQIVHSETLTCCKRISLKDAVIKGIQSERGREISCDAGKVTFRSEDIGHSSLPSEQNLNAAYKLLVILNFAWWRDAKEFYEFLSSSNTSLQEDPPTRLVAEWPDLLHCPSGKQVIPLRGHGFPANLDFGLEVSMSWIDTTRSTPLSLHNRQLKALSQARQYPTPPLEIRSSQQKYCLTYVYPNFTVTRRGLLCSHDKCIDRRMPHGLDGLQMHLESWHDNFTYRLRKEKVEDSVQYWRFDCEVAELKSDQRASDRAPDPRDISMIAPEQPFDIRKHLDEGNDDFRKAARLEKWPRHVLPTAPTPIPIFKRTNPEEVKNRPKLEKQKYRVPKAPSGLTFFRAVSKRPLEEGEYISESDDDVDVDWLELKRLHEIDRHTSASEPTKRFLKGFDLFIHEERLQDDIHVGDALIRFTRENSTWLWQEQLVDEFQEKIDGLLADNIISKEIHSSCRDTVKAAKSTQDQDKLSDKLASLGVRHSRSPLSPAGDRVNEGLQTKEKRSDKAKGKAKVTSMGHITPQTADSDGDTEMQDTVAAAHSITESPSSEPAQPPYDQCLCGHDAITNSDHRKTIMCQNQDCVRHTFHIDCIMQHWKPTEPPDPRKHSWVCRDCENDPEFTSSN